LSEAENGLVDSPATVFVELWTSLASMMRSYAGLRSYAGHGLHQGPAAEIEWDAAHILTRYRDKWLELKREGTHVTWMRENGNSGVLELTEGGRLRGAHGEEEMDMAAEAWARELMG
jgi:hypothetical protein